MLISILSLVLTSLPIGTNLNGLADYSPEIPFADAMKTARCFGSVASAYDCKFGSVIPPSGTDFGTVVHTTVAGLEGTYKISFSGKADLSTPGSSAKVQNLRYDPILNLTDAEIVLQKDSQLFLSFKNQNGVSNIKLIRPGLTDAMEFNPAFLNAIKPYSALRFMDWLHTNDNPIKTWADRPTITQATQVGPKGVALEYIVELANQSQKDLWINIPAMADDDYVYKLANFLYSNLDCKLKIYVEYSNEAWNFIFSQTVWNASQAKLDVAAGQSDLSLGGTDLNPTYWAWRRVAKRIGRISDIFKEVFGTASMNTKIRPILATQFGNVAIGRAQLSFFSKYLGAPSAKLYGLAGAPYFATQAADLPGATIDSVLAGLYGSVESKRLDFTASAWNGTTTSATSPNLATLAKFYGIKYIAYEGGQHLVPKTATGKILDLQVQTTQQMGDDYGRYLQLWFGCGGDIFMNFGMISLWGEHGYWGLQNNYALQTPKSVAVQGMASAIGPLKCQ